MPMIERGLQQLEKWGVDSVQDYCSNLIQPLLAYLRANGYWVEQDEYRASHLFGFLLPAKADKEKVFVRNLKKGK
jgi:hypothetical protein